MFGRKKNAGGHVEINGAERESAAPRKDAKAAKPQDGGRVFRNGAYASAITVAAIAVAVLVNLIAGALPKKYTSFDLTESSLYTLGGTSMELVQGLADDVTIYYLAQEGSEDAYVTRLLDRYAAESSRLTWQQKDPAVYPTFAAQNGAQDAGEGSLIVKCGERTTVVDAADLYQYDYADYYTNGTYTVSFDGENQITTAIYNLTSGEQSKAFYTTNHSEAALNSTLTAAIEKQNISLTALNLLSEEIPGDCALLIINVPQSDFLASGALVDEAGQLSDYLARGGAVLLVTDAYYETPNLDAVLAQFGLARTQGVIVEGDSSRCVNSSYASSVWQLPGNTCLLPNIETGEENTITANLGDAILVLPVAQGLTITETENVTAQALLTTSESAYSKAAGYAMESTDREEGDESGPFDLALFAQNDTTGGSIVWVGCGNVSADSADTAVNGGNSTFLLSCAASMTGQSSGILIGAKQLESDAITVAAAVSTGLGGLFLLGIPAAFVVFGIVMTVRRRRR